MPPCVDSFIVMKGIQDNRELIYELCVPHVYSGYFFLLVIARLHALHLKTKSKWTKASLLKLCYFLKQHGEKEVIETYRSNKRLYQKDVSITRTILCAITLNDLKVGKNLLEALEFYTIICGTEMLREALSRERQHFSCRNDDLRKILYAYGKKRTGRKKDLVQRIVDTISEKIEVIF